jgi:hypothetical protein
MRRLAALVVIGLGGLFACALWRGPPAEAEQQPGTAAAGQPNKPLPQQKSDAAEEKEEDAEDDAPEIDPLSANAACYICHMTFIGEGFSKVHLKEKITCIECHGVSGPHANDENIGATPPDITFERSEVDASCAECHEEHDVPPRKIIARWIERGLPDSSPICTDCHGTHKIEQAEEEEAEEAGSETAGSESATMAGE